MKMKKRVLSIVFVFIVIISLIFFIKGFQISNTSSHFTISLSEERWENISAPEGVFEPSNPSLFGTHINHFEIGFVNLSISSNEVLECKIKTSNKNILTINETGLSKSNENYTLSYSIKQTDSIIKDSNVGYIPWVLKNCSIIDSSENIVDFQNVSRRIYVHDDEYWEDNEVTRAVTCEGTPHVYFNNTGKCEFSEDTMFALQMRNGNPVNETCFNSPGIACADSYCNGIYFPTCDPVDYFSGFSIEEKDPNNYAEITSSFAGYSTPIAFTKYTNSSGTFKLRVLESLSSKSFSVTLYNLTNVDESNTNIYGPSSSQGDLSITNQGDGTYTVAFYNFSEYSGTLDFTFNISFTQEGLNDNRTMKVVIAYGTDTNQGDPDYFISLLNESVGLYNNDEGQITGITTDTGGVCGDEANNDFDYLGTFSGNDVWTWSYDCFDEDCHLMQGDDSQTNEFGSGKTGLCNYQTELNCSDEFDNDYDYVYDGSSNPGGNLDFTDCHDADCFHNGDGLNTCPTKELICNDSVNNDWDYTLGESDNSGDMKIENNGTKYDWTHQSDVTDCEDIDCDGKIGGSSGELCNWGYELNCSDNFDNDALQLKDCELNSVGSSTAQVTPTYAEYDCSSFCRSSVENHESGTQCFDNIDNDWDAITINGYYNDNYADYHDGGIDCRWGGYFGIGNNYNPEEECNLSLNSNLKRCELGRELTCNDKFDNDFDKDASGMPTPKWNLNTSLYFEIFGITYTSHGDYDDYDCAKESIVPSNEALNDSWCFDGVDNDLDAYYFSGNGYSQNSSGGFDCDDTDCFGIINPADEDEACIDSEYNASNPLFTNLPFPGRFCANNIDDDSDGPIDCDDLDCYRQFTMCSQGPCYKKEDIRWNSCADSIDNDNTNGTDCADSDCYGLFGSEEGDFCEQTESNCLDGFDNDADGNADCADSDCYGLVGDYRDGEVYCSSNENTLDLCYDGFDNDADGVYDCYESECNSYCELSDISGTNPISLPVNLGTTSLNSVSDAYIKDYTKQVRKGEYYNLTMKMDSSSSDAQWTLGTATGGSFQKSYFDTGTAQLQGPNSDNFTLTETSVGFTIESNEADLSSGYEMSFVIRANSVMSQSTYELTYAESTGSKLSLNNDIYHEINENVNPEAQKIEIIPNNTGINYGDSVYLRGNISDNNQLGVCQWEVYGQASFSPSDSTNCKASFSPTQEGTYYINLTPKDYYSNEGDTITKEYDLDIIPTKNEAELNQTFYNSTIDTLEFNFSFNVPSGDSLGNCEIMMKNSTNEYSMKNISATGNLCQGTIDISSINDGMYTFFAKVNETTEGNLILSKSDSSLICSQVVNGTCVFADFNNNTYPDICVKDTTPPEITLISPNNETSTTSPVNFKYSVTDSTDIANCSLIIDGSISETDTYITKETEQQFSETFSTGTYSWKINCTDEVGNIGESETRTITVKKPTTGPGGGGSDTGRGGISGGIAPSEPSYESFSIDKEEIRTRAYTNEIKTEMIEIKNTKEETIEFKIESDTSFALLPKNITLEPNETKIIPVKFYSPNRIGNYFGSVTVESEDGKKVIPIKLSVMAPSLLEIDTRVLDKSKLVTFEKEVFANITIKNKDDLKKNITLTYFIRRNAQEFKNKTENIMLNAGEEISIVRGLPKENTFLIKKDYFQTEVKYSKTTLHSEDNFIIINWITAIITLIVLGVLISLIIIKIKKNEKNEE